MISEYPKAYIYYSGDNKQQPQLYQYDLGRQDLELSINQVINR